MDNQAIKVTIIASGIVLLFLPNIVAQFRGIQATNRVAALNILALPLLLGAWLVNNWFLIGVAGLWIPAMWVALTGSRHTNSTTAKGVGASEQPLQSSRGKGLLCYVFASCLAVGGGIGIGVSGLWAVLLWLVAEETVAEKVTESRVLGGIGALSCLSVYMASRVTKKTPVSTVGSKT